MRTPERGLPETEQGGNSAKFETAPWWASTLIAFLLGAASTAAILMPTKGNEWELKAWRLQDRVHSLESHYKNVVEELSREKLANGRLKERLAYYGVNE